MKLLNIKLALFIVCAALSAFSFSQEAENKPAPVKRNYTEKEFLDAVNKEVENRLSKYKNKSIVQLTKELMKKERSIELRELEIQKKEESLRESEKDLTSKLKGFQQKSSKLLGCLDEHDKNQSKRVRHMVDVISGMRPQSAADVLSVQDVDISVKILGDLPPEKVSKIFNSMDKEISARLQKQFMSMKKY
jgi:flagellar motility protein MotE (MotC chaperone)